VTYTYDSSLLSSSALYQTRLQIGDNSEGNGILPGGANYDDDEISFVLSEFGDDVLSASIQLLENAATKWSTLADSRLGPQAVNYSDISKALASRAQTLREKGSTDGTSEVGAISVPIIREDGYSQDIPYASDDSNYNHAYYGGADPDRSDNWPA